jgi:hypothetical protein
VQVYVEEEPLCDVVVPHIETNAVNAVQVYAEEEPLCDVFVPHIETNAVSDLLQLRMNAVHLRMF